MDTTKHECCIHGYHIYKEIWDAAIGEELDSQWEPNNKSHSCSRQNFARQKFEGYNFNTASTWQNRQKFPAIRYTFEAFTNQFGFKMNVNISAAAVPLYQLQYNLLSLRVTQ